ncbi:MAG: phosphate-starvation-inducible PsiE family protein [Oculatellaceae cyanobacterium Prado106]|nr:phosphate-starvation-inducible PsiE family protein [Oculatellaceae cyanobacterium Prado106]
MPFLQKAYKYFRSSTSDESFLVALKKVETGVSKVLSIAMVAVLVTVVVELCIFLTKEIIFNNSFADPERFFTGTLIKVFGLFLNVLIALEILENITAYLKKHVVQLELVVVTSLTAVARKIIIFDFTKSTGLELIALAAAVFALTISYWIVRRANKSGTGH